MLLMHSALGATAVVPMVPAGGRTALQGVAARTAGAEHPTSVFVGCGACILFRLINKFYHVYKKVNIINKEKRIRYMLL